MISCFLLLICLVCPFHLAVMKLFFKFTEIISPRKIKCSWKKKKKVRQYPKATGMIQYLTHSLSNGHREAKQEDSNEMDGTELEISKRINAG